MNLYKDINEFDEKDYNKFLIRVSNGIKRSSEYNSYMNYIKKALGENLERHYTPFSVYDVTSILINKYKATGEKVCEFNIMSDVIELIYRDKIPYCTVSKAEHIKIHSGEIPDFRFVENQFARFHSFIEEYYQYMTDEQKKKLCSTIDRINGGATTEERVQLLIDDLKHKSYTIYSDPSEMDKDRDLLEALDKDPIDLNHSGFLGRCPDSDLIKDFKCDSRCDKNLALQTECWREALKMSIPKIFPTP